MTRGPGRDSRQVSRRGSGARTRHNRSTSPGCRQNQQKPGAGSLNPQPRHQAPRSVRVVCSGSRDTGARAAFCSMCCEVGAGGGLEPPPPGSKPGGLPITPSGIDWSVEVGAGGGLEPPLPGSGPDALPITPPGIGVSAQGGLSAAGRQDGVEDVQERHAGASASTGASAEGASGTDTSAGSISPGGVQPASRSRRSVMCQHFTLKV